MPGERYIVFGSNYGPAILTNEGWKLRYYSARDVFELYNLKDDPQERYDLSDRYPEKVKELKKLLLKECESNLENGVNRVG